MINYRVAAYSCGVLGKPFLGLERSDSLVLEPLVVLEQGHEGLGLLPDVDALVLVVVKVLEILQRLDGEDVFFALLSDL